MAKFQKKPVTVEAFQMTKVRRLDNIDWPDWLNQAWQKDLVEVGSVFCCSDGCLEGEKATPIFVHTLSGPVKVAWDWWIIQGVDGELYPCEPLIFEKTYQPV